MLAASSVAMVACGGGVDDAGRSTELERARTSGDGWRIPTHRCSRGSQPGERVDELGRLEQWCQDDDQRVGDYVAWYPSGWKVVQGTYVEGARDGTWTWWHDGGGVAVRGRYARGRAEGEWTWKHPNGRQAVVGPYAGGHRTGEWKAWHPDGSRAAQGYYQSGRMLEGWDSWTPGTAPPE